MSLTPASLKYKRQTKSSAGEVVEKLESSYTAGRTVTWRSPIGRPSGGPSEGSPYDPVISLLGAHLRALKICDTKTF